MAYIAPAFSLDRLCRARSDADQPLVVLFLVGGEDIGPSRTVVPGPPVVPKTRFLVLDLNGVLDAFTHQRSPLCPTASRRRRYTMVPQCTSKTN